MDIVKISTNSQNKRKINLIDKNDIKRTRKI